MGMGSCGRITGSRRLVKGSSLPKLGNGSQSTNSQVTAGRRMSFAVTKFGSGSTAVQQVSSPERGES